MAWFTSVETVYAYKNFCTCSQITETVQYKVHLTQANRRWSGKSISAPRFVFIFYCVCEIRLKEKKKKKLGVTFYQFSNYTFSRNKSLLTRNVYVVSLFGTGFWSSMRQCFNSEYYIVICPIELRKKTNYGWSVTSMVPHSSFTDRVPIWNNKKDAYLGYISILVALKSDICNKLVV